MISVVILTKNEEENIIDCLEKILWVDEIIIIDDNSEDRTIEVIKSLNNGKIKIYERWLNNNFSEQRNFGLSKSTKEWVLFIDADERVSEELKDELNSIVINKDRKSIGFLIKRVDYIGGKKLKYGEVGNLKLLRFAKRGSGSWVGSVHEEWQIDGDVSELEAELLHYPHPNVKEFLWEINFYSSLKSKELFENKIKMSPQDTLLYPLGKFIRNYFFKLGFFDGLEGLVFAIMMSFHSFLVRGKLWLLWNKKL